MKAFPSISNKRMQDSDGFWFTPGSEGMDLRDYFAAKAMQAMLTNPEFLNVVTKEEINGKDCASRVAKVSYKYADAMMEARG